MEMEKPIVLARLRRAHGLKGELVLESFTEPAEAVFAVEPLILRQEGVPPRAVKCIVRSAFGVNLFRITFAGCNDRRATEAYTGGLLEAPRASLPEAPEGAMYWFDIEGMAALDVQERPLGRVRDVRDFGAGPLLEIEPADGGESFFVRFAPPELVELRRERGEVVLAPLPFFGEAADS